VAAVDDTAEYVSLWAATALSAPAAAPQNGGRSSSRMRWTLSSRPAPNPPEPPPRPMLHAVTRPHRARLLLLRQTSKPNPARLGAPGVSC
jgi:hypothetical protein